MEETGHVKGPGNNDYYSTGGGGGWYGGSAGSTSGATGGGGGGGGSGFVYTLNSNIPENYGLGREYCLNNARTISGDVEFLSPEGIYETGHEGDGYARITFLE